MRPLLFLFFATVLSAGDWPQFLGPQRDSKAAAGTVLPETMPEDGWNIAWKADCGAGFAGPVVSGGKVVLFHRSKELDTVQAWDVVTGREVWKTTWPATYEDDFGFDAGPRSCPTVHDGRVYCYGADGVLTALNLADGKILWSKDLVKELGSAKGFFGRCCAPLVSGDSVILAAGGEGAGVAAFHRLTGALQWKALEEEAGYASPILLPAADGAPAVFFTREGIAGLAPADGRVLFREPFRSRQHASVNAASPVLTGDGRFFTSACYDVGAAVWELGKNGKLSAVWRAPDKLDCHYSTPVVVEGHLYGFHGRQESGQELRCVRASDGEVRWSQPLAAGHVIAAGGRLLILTEQGELILAAASPDKKPALTARGEILRGGHRAPPALAGGFLYAKDKSRLVAVKLAAD
jgi:outer membrane protein assembly factor BamB